MGLSTHAVANAASNASRIDFRTIISTSHPRMTAAQSDAVAARASVTNSDSETQPRRETPVAVVSVEHRRLEDGSRELADVKARDLEEGRGHDLVAAQLVRDA